MTRRGLLAVALAVTLCLSLAGFAAGSAVAGDQVAVIAPNPHAVDADPGEEFEVDVVLRSQGGHGGVGVSSVDLVSQYSPDSLEITAVEPGPWLEAGEETEVHAAETLDHEAGTASLEQWREPVAGGAIGNDVVVTLTVEVAADAPASETTISFGDSAIELENGFLLATHNQDVTVSIDGGGDDTETDGDEPDESPAADESGGADSDDESAPETNDDSSSDSSDDDSSDDDADPVPGFAIGAILAALTMLLLSAVLAARSRRGV